MLVSGTVMDIPFPVNVSNLTSDAHDLPCTILFDNGTTTSIPLLQMANLIPPPPITPSAVNDSYAFFHLSSGSTQVSHKNTKDSTRRAILVSKKGFTGSFKSHVNKCKEDWGIPLPNFLSTWVDLCVEGIFIAGHVPHSLLQSPLSSKPATFNPVTSFVSAIIFIKTTHLLFSKLWQILIRTEKFGWRAFLRKNVGSKTLTITKRLLLVSILCYVKKGHLGQF
jgi:hypothetical protein